MKKDICILCRKPLVNGIIINGRGICKCCEEKLIKADVETDFYEYYKGCIRRKIVQPMLKGADIGCQSYHL